MRRKDDWLIRIGDIKEAAGKIAKFTKGMSFKSFCDDEKTIDAVIRNFEIIGEAVRHIPPLIRKKRPEIPWAEMQGLRNVLIHEYFGVSLEIVWNTVQQSIPQLMRALRKIG